MNPDLQRIEQDIQELKQWIHSPRVNLNTDVIGMFEVVSSVPAGIPKNAFDQIKIYVSGTTKTLYVYDYVNHAWRSVTLS